MGRHTTRTARLGQHFLTRPEIAGWIADAAAIHKDDTVVEIGPGRGILTRELLARAGKVVAIEKDDGLIPGLHDMFSDEIATHKLTIHEQDIRDTNPDALCPDTYKLVANIPYYLTGFIMRHFLTAAHQPTDMVLLVQKEVAERVCALDHKESLLSLSVKAYGTPLCERVVKAGAFNPPPKVDSAVLTIHDISRKRFISLEHEERFFTLLHAAFQHKRKHLTGTIGSHIDTPTWARCGVEPTARPETVPVDMWCCLTRH